MDSSSIKGAPKKPAIACSVCGTPVETLKSGLCDRCFSHPEPESALLADQCALCGMSDGRMLRPAQVGDEIHCLCRNHAWLAEKARPRPESLESLRAWLVPAGNRRRSLERRQGDRRRSARRGALPDRRLVIRVPDKGERRVDDRRGAKT